MLLKFGLGVLAVTLTAVTVASPTPAAAKRAVAKAVPLLQASGKTWQKTATCTSCHHQSVGFIALQVAKDNGLKIDEKEFAAQFADSNKRRSKYAAPMFELTGAINGVLGHGYQILAYSARSHPGDDFTEGVEFFLTGMQTADGHWTSTSHRPPLESSDVTGTALALRALTAYASTERAKAAIARGRAWLKAAKPVDAEERAFRLLGLVWSHADKATIVGARNAVLAAQRPDGGWAQVDDRASDAYATGLSFMALRVAGLGARGRTLSRAADWLVQTQEGDGSWHVKTRRVVEGLPYFETGFPHGVDQFISYTASSWATAALAVYATDGHTRALTRVPSTRAKTSLRFSSAQMTHSLLKAASSGDLAGVQKAIKGGASPNAKTDKGVTALMVAVRYPAVVSALLTAGADVNAKSEAGTTALHMAARTFGAVASLKSLLAHGAREAVRQAEVAETPLTLAAESYDPERLRILMDHGHQLVGPNEEALFCAANQNDMASVEFLFSRGATARKENKEYGGNLVNDMVINRNPVMVERMLRAGASPNVIDKEGWSALQVAAQGDPWDSKIVSLLLAAGADPTYATKDKPRALELAEKWGNTVSAGLLRVARYSRSELSTSPVGSVKKAFVQNPDLSVSSCTSCMARRGP